MSTFIVQTFFWVLVIYGVTQIITEATIFNALRKALLDSKWMAVNLIGQLVSCFLCTSVWISTAASIVLGGPSSVLFPEWGDPYMITWTVTDAMFGSALVWLIHCIEYKLTS